MFKAGGRSRWLAIGLVAAGLAGVVFFPELFAPSENTVSSTASPQSQTATENDDAPGSVGRAAATKDANAVPLDGSTQSSQSAQSSQDRSASAAPVPERRAANAPAVNRRPTNSSDTRNSSVRVATSDSGSSSKRSELREVGRDTYMSSGGLLYARGSRHGHRLDHVLAHGRDEPNRPGFHGVFADGERLAVVTLIDEAYQRAEAGGRGVQKKVEDRRTVYTIDMGRTVGYVGGEAGNRRGRPEAHHIRLVLEGKRVITAFPLVP